MRASALRDRDRVFGQGVGLLEVLQERDVALAGRARCWDAGDQGGTVLSLLCFDSEAAGTHRTEERGDEEDSLSASSR